MPFSIKTFLLLVMTSEFCFICSVANDQEAPSMVKLLTSSFEPSEWEPVNHQTSLGLIKGKKEISTGSQTVVPHYYAFRGIPFALPPVGDLRLADTVDATSAWPEGQLDASRFRSFCPQYDGDLKQVIGDEDCLYLNIFTPALPGTETEQSTGRPVFVFIHGGGFIRGTSSLLFGGRLAGQNIILVTLNYRLGALGFLSTEDEVIPGNYGMLDQVSALRWVKRHIAEFGGDPDRVTVSGFSAGAGSSHLHMYSSLSNGLFHNVYLASGSAHCSWALQRSPQKGVENYAKALKCPWQSSKDLKACMLSKTTEELLEAQASILRYEFWPVPFTPIIDAKFRKKPFLAGPLEELKISKSMPILVSVTPQEGLLFALTVILRSQEPSNPKAIYDQAASDIVSCLWHRPDEDERVGEAARSFYYSKHSETSLNVLFEEMTESMSAFLFQVCSPYSAAELAKNGNQVYSYIYAHRKPTTPVWASALYKGAQALGINSPLLSTGVTHGDDLRIVFGPPGSLDPIDEYVANLQTMTWVNFVVNGTPSNSENDWPRVQPGGPVLSYNISSDPHMRVTPFKAKESNFWLQTLPWVEKTRTSQEKHRQDLMPWITGAIATVVVYAIANLRR